MKDGNYNEWLIYIYQYHIGIMYAKMNVKNIINENYTPHFPIPISAKALQRTRVLTVCDFSLLSLCWSHPWSLESLLPRCHQPIRTRLVKVSTDLTSTLLNATVLTSLTCQPVAAFLKLIYRLASESPCSLSGPLWHSFFLFALAGFRSRSSAEWSLDVLSSPATQSLLQWSRPGLPLKDHLQADDS